MEGLYNGLLHAHSGFRWIALVALLLIVIHFLIKWRSSSNFEKKDKTLLTIGLGTFHTQATIGMILFFISPKVQFGAETMSNSVIRFFTMEHTLMMIIAAVLITIGRKKALKLEDSKLQFKTAFIFHLIALIIVLAMIPWPFRNLGAAWF